MKTGVIEKVKFDRLTSPKLNLKIKEYSVLDEYNCSTAALSILTGLSVKFLQKICKGKDYWYIEDVLKFLKKRNYKIVEVTKKNVTNNKQWWNVPLNYNHCILMFLKMDNKEYSAFVMHKNITWHNFRPATIDALYLLNRPTEHVYIIQHKKWM